MADASPGIWPVTAFEHFLYAGDRPTQPTAFWLRLTVQGSVDAERLAAALEVAVKHHPLLAARLSGDVGACTAALRWRAEPGRPWLDVGPEGAPLVFPGGAAAIDPARDAGLRVFVRQGPARATVLLQVHPAASDALGAVKFLEDVLAVYDNPAAVPVRGPDLGLLQGRGDFHLSGPERRRCLVQALLRLFLFDRKRPAPVASDLQGSVPLRTDVLPAAAAGELSAAALAALRGVARRRSGTLNDLLLRDLFLTLDAWNGSHGGRHNLRLAVPLGMRHFGDEATAPANAFGMCSLDRGVRQLEDGDALLTSLIRETAYVNTHVLGYALVFVAGLCGRVRGGMSWLATPRRFFGRAPASAALGNLGEPMAGSRLPRDSTGRTSAGGLTLTRLEFLPSLRPGTPLAVGAVTYAGRLTLSLHYDHTKLSAVAATALLEALTARLGASATAATAEDGGLLLDRLIKEHAVKRQGGGTFRAWAVGKHVVTGPVRGFDEPHRTLPPTAGYGHQVHPTHRGEHPS